MFLWIPPVLFSILKKATEGTSVAFIFQGNEIQLMESKETHTVFFKTATVAVFGLRGWLNINPCKRECFSTQTATYITKDANARWAG